MLQAEAVLHVTSCLPLVDPTMNYRYATERLAFYLSLVCATFDPPTFVVLVLLALHVLLYCIQALVHQLPSDRAVKHEPAAVRKHHALKHGVHADKPVIFVLASASATLRVYDM